MPPINAFVHPDDPKAVFPTKYRQKLIDYRSSAVEEAKTAMPINFRKLVPSKYATKVWTAEQLKEQEMNDMANLIETKLDTGKEPNDNKSESSVEENMGKLALTKEDEGDVKMGEIAHRGKAIKKKGKGKGKGKNKYRSYKIVNF